MESGQTPNGNVSEQASNAPIKTGEGNEGFLNKVGKTVRENLESVFDAEPVDGKTEVGKTEVGKTGADQIVVAKGGNRRNRSQRQRQRQRQYGGSKRRSRSRSGSRRRRNRKSRKGGRK